MNELHGRILVIDDDELLGKMFRRALVPEHDVVVVARAEEALGRIAGGERFDLILCDLMLPRVTGIDFYERLGAQAPELIARVVFLTGGAFTARSRAFLARANITWIEKPLPSISEFRALVRAHLTRVASHHAISVAGT